MWYTSKQVWWAKLVMYAVTGIALVALYFAFNALSTSRQTQQGVVDQCNLTAHLIDDQTLRDYCTLLYHKYNRGG